MEQTWRWYGPDNSASLADICQAGATGVATTLYHIPNGEIWSMEEILKHKAIAEDVGLVWSIVESVPVHGDIKTHTGDCEQWIANYQQTLCNLAQCGIRTMYYNFMPAFGWTCTDLKYVPSDGSKALRFGRIEFVAFEMHILKRPGTEVDYIEEEIAQAAERFVTMSDEDKVRPARSIITGLLGAEEGYTLDQFRKHLELCKDIDKAKLRENFAVFLKATIPVAEEVGMRMAVHPDDSPRPIPGLPHTVSTIEDMQQMVDTVNNMVNGFTMCTGSYDVRTDNDLVGMIRRSGPRTYFTRLHSTMRGDNPKTFHEAAHLNGDVDMYEVAKVIVEEEHRRKAEGKEGLIPMRPDHDRQMLGDLRKKTNPGYSVIGRLKGLAEAHGIELAIQRAFSNR